MDTAPWPLTEAVTSQAVVSHGPAIPRREVDAATATFESRAPQWQADYLDECRVRALLQQSAARLTKPKLAAAVVHWRRDWESEEHTLKTTSLAEQLKAQEAAPCLEAETFCVACCSYGYR